MQKLQHVCCLFYVFETLPLLFFVGTKSSMNVLHSWCALEIKGCLILEKIVFAAFLYVQTIQKSC